MNFTKHVIALLIAATTNLPVVAQSRITSYSPQSERMESYFAYIGYQDLFNSSGNRLTKPWEVLRQDRANYHRFGRVDRLDQGDSFFGNERNRAIMESMLARGSISPQAARDILAGDALVLVEIHGYGAVGTEIHISVAR
jgi:hypothetical protein